MRDFFESLRDFFPLCSILGLDLVLELGHVVGGSGTDQSGSSYLLCEFHTFFPKHASSI